MPSHGQTRKKGAGSSEENHVFDKTKLCSFFQRDQCTKGADCTFAHCTAEVLPQPNFFKSQMCTAVMKQGFCIYGSACRFAHSEIELQNAKKNPRVRGAKDNRSQPGLAETGLASEHPIASSTTSDFKRMQGTKVDGGVMNGKNGEVMVMESDGVMKWEKQSTSQVSTRSFLRGVSNALSDGSFEPSQVSVDSANREEKDRGFDTSLPVQLIVKNSFLHVQDVIPACKRSSSTPARARR
mmetsp:Transcript_146301/g.469289  ORF Transcript_146301/g.469289 Transcript_146301/m.469289 type:complete len:239 (-) Transcript_146301:122-838(-)